MVLDLSLEKIPIYIYISNNAHVQCGKSILSIFKQELATYGLKSLIIQFPQR